MSEKLNTKAVTPVFRGSFPSLFAPKKDDRDGKEYYSVEAIFGNPEKMNETDKKAWKIMQQAAENACINNWGADKNKWPKNLRNPFRPATDKEREGKLPNGYAPDGKFMNLRCQAKINKPTVVDQNVQQVIDEHKVYAGVYLKAEVNAFAYPRAGMPGKTGMQPGVSFGLNHVQIVKDGEPLTGKSKAEDAFEAIDLGDSEVSDTDAASVFA